MVNAKTRDELLLSFRTKYEELLKQNLEGVDVMRYCSNGDRNAVKQVCEKIRSTMILSMPNGYKLPSTSLHVTCSGSTDSEITLVSLSLSNSFRSDKKFKFAIQIPVSQTVEAQVVSFFKASYDNLFNDILIMENIDEINEIIDEVVKASGAAYTVRLVSPLNRKSHKISYISDTEVEFVADMNNIFEIDDILAFYEPDELFTEEKIQAAKQALADEFGTIQTTVGLAEAHGGSLLRYLCNIGTQVKAITLLRKVASKNVEFLRGEKDTIAYYEKDGVFALVGRTDGKFEVILSPLDVKTLEKVDKDILAEISA